jgi:6-pyruvoyltetrahydropterin/6-carboxytetrahydropterin synthase
MTTVTRKFSVDAGHRVWGHEGKCKNLHGHTYLFEVTVDAPELDGLGRVVDFSVIKDIIGKWLDWHWDHNMILNSQDPLAISWMNYSTSTFPGSDEKLERKVPHDILGFKAPYILLDKNPTAENLAKELMVIGNSLLGGGNARLTVVKVVCHETPNCFATYRT